MLKMYLFIHINKIRQHSSFKSDIKKQKAAKNTQIKPKKKPINICIL